MSGKMSTAETTSSSGQQKPRLSWSLWLLIWIGAAIGHFCIFSVLAVTMPFPAPRWFEVGFGFFASVAEDYLMRTTDYHGQDAIQWPLICGNSLIYGAIYAAIVAAVTALMAMTSAGLPTRTPISRETYLRQKRRKQ